MHIKLIKRVIDIGFKKFYVHSYINPSIVALGFSFNHHKAADNGPKYELDLHLWPAHLRVHCWWNFFFYTDAAGKTTDAREKKP